MSRENRHLSVLFTASEIDPARLPRATVAIIDVLRATSVLPVAFAAKAASVIPARTIEEAVSLRGSLGEAQSLLCGERQGKKVPGFDLGNSPLEYTPARVQGRTLIHASTNGSPALLRAGTARRVVAGSFLNAAATIAALSESDDRILVASGNEGRPSLEDVACAGFLVARLLHEEPDLRLNDGALMSRDIWRRWEPDVRGLLGASRHGIYLVSLGFVDDLDVCARVDSVPVVPVLRDGRLVPLVAA